VKEHPELKKLVQQFMWRKLLGPSSWDRVSQVSSLQGCAKPPHKSAETMEEKSQCRADDVQKKVYSFVEFQNPDFHT
jgi:hypothetical protein